MSKLWWKSNKSIFYGKSFSLIRHNPITLLINIQKTSCFQHLQCVLDYQYSTYAEIDNNFGIPITPFA